MPTDTVYTDGMKSYVDEAIAAIEVGGATGGSGNVVCDTLLDITTTEQTKIVGITIDNLDEYFTLYIAGYITPCEDLTAASTAMLVFRGNAISRELPVGYPNMTPKDFGKFAYVFNINNGIMTGTGHLRKANWTNDTTGCPIDLPYPNEKNLIKIQALNAPYLPIGTQLVIKGLRKSEV